MSNPILSLQSKVRFSDFSCYLLRKTDESYHVLWKLSHHANPQFHSAKPANACVFIWFVNDFTCASNSTYLGVHEVSQFQQHCLQILLLRLFNLSCFSCHSCRPHWVSISFHQCPRKISFPNQWKIVLIQCHKPLAFQPSLHHLITWRTPLAGFHCKH